MNAGQKRVVGAGVGVILAGALAVLGLWLGRGGMVRKTGFIRENLERLRMGEKEIIPDDNLYEIVKKNLSSEEDSKSKILSKIKKVFKRDK